MPKILILLILVGVFVLVNPGFRAQIVPYVEPVLNPLYEWSANSRIRDISRRIEEAHAAGSRVPDARTFERFIRREYGGHRPQDDPWGTPYYLQERHGAVVVGSAGRDRTPGTEHDLRSDPISLR